MPTYEYACKSCGEHLEVVQSFKDSPLTQCPACGGALRKVFGNIGIAFKGSGFYKTDSRSETKKAKAGPAKEAKEATASSTASSESNGSSSGGGGSGSAATSTAASSAGGAKVAAAS
jgi:putative FmdB family regulatory protein